MIFSVIRKHIYQVTVSIFLCCSVIVITAASFNLFAGAADNLESNSAPLELSPFHSDGCSWFPDGNFSNQTLWQQCCFHHDLYYWRGGTEAERRHADNELAHCVTQLGQPQVAQMMLRGVRVGGMPYWPTHFRWGYGWPYSRGYAPLNHSETQMINEQLIKQGVHQTPWALSNTPLLK
ncbi:hypothetical protein [Marinibactrum halimedae]|uniref:Uncharacterized protein n=1 Tax=Marinibactrum halimedae TaxID=1444977 RepID=A0AA37T4B2_9GAMM|nr:hypothetical protein [Marinibactrum halimedae]MCD9457773.1 hypothetical protein [Marinibactrum halimedae]GLS24853.1 hypothetical protein GCM10007877_05670 [Marinibactrum halimedae]